MKLNEFITEAKRNTYASNGEGGESDLPNGGKELTFQTKDYSYKDVYFGNNPFIGEETVVKENKTIWGMNYYGKTTTDKISPKEIYTFLRKAMKLVQDESPYRGPKEFVEQDFKYINQFEGDINTFKGTEKILFNEEVVYILHYHGGSIK